jgi:putative sigma-54 modulation protein
MKLLIQGNNIEVTEAIRNYVEEKLENAVKHFQQLTSKVDVHLSVAHNSRVSDRAQAEVTVYANGKVIRAQEQSGDLYASVDLVADKIARQLRKYKEKHLDKKIHESPKTAEAVAPEPVSEDLISDRSPELPEDVVRVKYFAMPPMSIEEAKEQLQLVDHDFYVFCNEETGNINVIYQRNHGGYGVIQPRNGNGHTQGLLSEKGHETSNNHNGHSKSSVEGEELSEYPPAAEV